MTARIPPSSNCRCQVDAVVWPSTQTVTRVIHVSDVIQASFSVVNNTLKSLLLRAYKSGIPLSPLTTRWQQ